MNYLPSPPSFPIIYKNLQPHDNICLQKTNEYTDENEEIIKEFCSQNKGFIYAEYPYQIIPCHHSKSQREGKKLSVNITILH